MVAADERERAVPVVAASMRSYFEQFIPHMLHTLARTKSPNFVGKYTIHDTRSLWVLPFTVL